MKSKSLLTAFVGLSVCVSHAQSVGNFEDLTLPSANSNFLDIAPTPDGDYSFQSGSFIFSGNYNTAWSSWSGVTYSNHRDSLTPGSANQYAAVAGSGYNQSENYAVMNTFSPVIVKLESGQEGSIIEGVRVTNATYAYWSMKDGDSFAKKFGGTTGNDPDFFLLSIFGYANGVATTDTVHFYLADYRFADNSQDYIVDSWEFVDLQSLGAVDSIGFVLKSSDEGEFGMNTPAYFCTDDFKIKTNISIQEPFTVAVNVFPNPSSDFVNFQSAEQIKEVSFFTLTGQKMMVVANPSSIDVQYLPTGVYFLQIKTDKNEMITTKWIKN